MGVGDWLMATAQAKKLSEATGKKVAVIGRNQKPQWSEVFDNNPRLTRFPDHNSARLVNGPGLRPYIAAKTPDRWTWKRWDIAPGELFFSKAEREFAAPYKGRILIEPATKVPDSNKAWIWERWEELVRSYPPDTFIQTGQSGMRRVGARVVETPTFRHACAVLAVSRAFVGTEGGLHHAAAALGVRAVVLFSEFISPEFTGYPTHRNLRHAGAACGMRRPCASCKASMEAITVDEVRRNLEEIT